MFHRFSGARCVRQDILPFVIIVVRGVLGLLGTYVGRQPSPAPLFHAEQALPSAIDTKSHPTPDQFALIAARPSKRRPVLKSLPGLFAAGFIVHRLALRYLGWFVRKSIRHNIHAAFVWTLFATSCCKVAPPQFNSINDGPIVHDHADRLLWLSLRLVHLGKCAQW